MKTPEEIKQRLELCRVESGTCEGCPYFKDEHCISHGNFDALAYIWQLETRLVEANKTSDDLRAKLAESEKPQVPLTFEEAYGADYCYIEFSAQEIPRPYVVMIGSMTANGENKKIVRIYEFGEDVERCLKLRGEDYGKTWRCWPRKPTDEERKAVKWDD